MNTVKQRTLVKTQAGHRGKDSLVPDVPDPPGMLGSPFDSWLSFTSRAWDMFFSLISGHLLWRNNIQYLVYKNILNGVQCILSHLFFTTILEEGIIIPTYRHWNWSTKSKRNLPKVMWNKSNRTRTWSQVMWFWTQVFFALLLILFCDVRGTDVFRELQVAQSIGEKLEISLER